MKVSPFAGKPAKPSMLVNIPKLITAYYAESPDPNVPAQRVAFGTSGHRGSAFDKAFNEKHILAITQAICLYRWKPIAQRYKLNLTVVNEAVDPTFRFMTVDWDGQIRMDPSSPYAMQGLIGLKDRFDIAFACD